MKDKGFYARQVYRKRLRKWSSRYFYSRLYRDRNPDITKSMVVAGTARSGTTWLAQMISSQLSCRLMFEPFHSKIVPEYASFNYFQYMRPQDTNDALYTYCQRVLTGAIRHPWIDRTVETLHPKFRIVKEIRANLFLKWLHHQFPSVPILFIMRHPCAVVQSRLHLRWATDDDIAPMLAQPDLVDDHLRDLTDVLTNAKSPEQKHAVIWCISNLVPLRQFDDGELTVIFYEDLCTRPEEVIPQIFGAIRRPFDSSVYETLRNPSATATAHSAVLHGRRRVTQWQSLLAPRQVSEILAVVQSFGLDFLYDSEPLPKIRSGRAAFMQWAP